MDIQKAVIWYNKAVDKGNIDAMANLGTLYEYGIGIGKDEKKAFSLYKKAAEQGNAYAQTRLALLYYFGTGTPKDGDLAVIWMSKAKENGFEGAEEMLENLKFVVSYEKNPSNQPIGNNHKSPYYTIDSKQTSSSTTILMEKRNMVYYVPCKINGVRADFIFDTGAGMISLSAGFAEKLIEQGLISRDDVLGQANSQVADGRIQAVTIVNIRDVEIGGLHLYNVKASIKEQQNAPLLLGQSAIEKLGRVTIDGYKLIIHRN
jgi:aspartyl protease family protein